MASTDAKQAYGPAEASVNPRNKRKGGKSKQHKKTLGSLLKYFEGLELVVELKTGRLYRGILSSADEYMNLVFDSAQDDTSPSSPGPTLVNLHIRGPKIRYIHFPDHLDLEQVAQQGMDRIKAAEQKYSRKRRKAST